MDEKSNSNAVKPTSSRKHKDSEGQYESDGFEEIERRSGEESEFSEEDEAKKQKEKASMNLTSTVINTNANTNVNTVTNAIKPQRNTSKTFEEGIQSRDTDKITKEKSKAFNSITSLRSSKETPQLIFDNQSLQGELQRLKEENAFFKMEKAKLLSIKNNEIAILNEKLSKLSQNALYSAKEIEKLTNLLAENKRAINDYDNAVSQLTAMTNQNDKLKANNESLMKVINALKQERLTLSSSLESFKTESMTIKQEKMYLMKKTMTQSELIKSLTLRNEANDKEIAELKEDRTSLISKLTSKDVEVERAFRSALERETSKSKAKYSEDIKELKQSFNQLLINKTKYISEHCEDLQQRIFSYEKGIKDKTAQADYLAIELNNKKSINEEENDHLKLQLKIQQEEISRLSVLYSESLQLVELSQKEIAMLKEKYDVIRNELIANEAKAKEEITSYKSKWLFERERNEDYIQLESELDKVICDAALISTADEHSLELMERLNALPMNNKKRISQCVILANKVKYLIIDNENLRSANGLLRMESEKTKDERDAFEGLAIKIKEPYEYLITKLQAKEEENASLTRQLNEKDKSISAVIKDNRRLEETVKEMESDLRTVLANRKQLENLEGIVQSHIEEDRSKWHLIEWQKQQWELMNKKQTKAQVTDKLKLSTWLNKVC